MLGKFTDYDSKGPTLSLEEVFQDRCGDLNVPVLRGLMIGHARPNSRSSRCYW